MIRSEARQLAAVLAILFLSTAVRSGAEDAAPAEAAAPPGAAAASSPSSAPDDAGKNATSGGQGSGEDKGSAAKKAADAPEPRHGQRSKAADGSLLVYDKVVGAYRATEHVSTYWIDGRFWRFEDGVWSSADKFDGPWSVVSAQVVPKAARDQHSAPKTTTKMVLPSGREAIFEPRLKVHKVVGLKGVFLFDGEFYRYDGGVWFASQGEDGPWRPTSGKPLPPPLKRALPEPVHGDKVTMPSGAVLVYDGNSRLYSVEGRPATVFFDGAFYEREEDRWMRSVDGGAQMQPVEVTTVPVPVRAKYHTPAGGKQAASKNKPAAQKKAAPGKRPPAKAGAAPKAGNGKQAARKQGGSGSGAVAKKPVAAKQPKAQESNAADSNDGESKAGEPPAADPKPENPESGGSPAADPAPPSEH